MRRIVLFCSLTALATFVALFGLSSLRSELLASCRVPDACSTAIQYFEHDPYCVIDPVCASPFYEDDWSGMAPRWQGLAWLQDELLIKEHGLEALAVPNYVLFMLFSCLAVAAVAWKVSRPHARTILLTAIFSWVVLEILRWFAVISSVDPTVSFFNWELGIVLTMSVAWLALVGVVAGRRRSLPANRGLGLRSGT